MHFLSIFFSGCVQCPLDLLAFQLCIQKARFAVHFPRTQSARVLLPTRGGMLIQPSAFLQSASTSGFVSSSPQNVISI